MNILRVRAVKILQFKTVWSMLSAFFVRKARPYSGLAL